MEYCKLSANWLVNRPPNVTPTQSASFPLTGLTAYEVIFNRCDVQPGQRLFINGGSTSVGIFAIQLAKIRGAHVTVSASGGKEDLLRSLGADEVRRQSCIQDAILIDTFSSLSTIPKSPCRLISPNTPRRRNLTTSWRLLGWSILPYTPRAILISLLVGST